MPGSLSDIGPYGPFASFADRWHVVMWDQRGQGLLLARCPRKPSRAQLERRLRLDVRRLPSGRGAKSDPAGTDRRGRQVSTSLWSRACSRASPFRNRHAPPSRACPARTPNPSRLFGACVAPHYWRLGSRGTSPPDLRAISTSGSVGGATPEAWPTPWKVSRWVSGPSRSKHPGGRAGADGKRFPSLPCGQWEEAFDSH